MTSHVFYSLVTQMAQMMDVTRFSSSASTKDMRMASE